MPTRQESDIRPFHCLECNRYSIIDTWIEPNNMGDTVCPKCGELTFMEEESAEMIMERYNSEMGKIEKQLSRHKLTILKLEKENHNLKQS